MTFEWEAVCREVEKLPVVRRSIGKLIEISGALAVGAEAIATGFATNSPEAANSQGNSSGPPRTRTEGDERAPGALSIVERAESVAYGRADPRGEGDEQRSAAVSGNTVANVLRALLFEAKAAGVSSGCDAVMAAQALLNDLEPK